MHYGREKLDCILEIHRRIIAISDQLQVFWVLTPEKQNIKLYLCKEGKFTIL